MKFTHDQHKIPIPGKYPDKSLMQTYGKGKRKKPKKNKVA